jgi:hypothetical protein
MRKLLEAEAKKHEWDDKADTFSYDGGDMDDALEKDGMDVKECGSIPLKKWTVVKNDLGIPLRKQGKGFVLYEKKGVPFLLGISAIYQKVYDGNGYGDISVASLRNVFVPYDD